MKRVSDEDLKYIKETGITLGIDSQKALAKELLELRAENEKLKKQLENAINLIRKLQKANRS